MAKQKNAASNIHNDLLGPLMSVALGATVMSMAVSFSTHHLTSTAHGTHSIHDLTHAFEREREVLHNHANLARARYAVVSGGAQ